MRTSQRTFYKTIMVSEILSEEPLPVMDLEGLAEYVTNGPGSLRMLSSHEIKIGGQEAATLLQLQASDPEFFGLDADGHDIRDEAGQDLGLVRVVFHWHDGWGICYDCGLPAAYTTRPRDSDGPPEIHEKFCSVCAAQHAADGATISRLED